MKRTDYITPDELFMGIAKLASKRSKDPRTRCGACIANDMHRVVSVGYNGFPRGCSDDEFSWEREEKHKYVIHAEENAILNATQSLEGCILYIYSDRGFYPCRECAKIILQMGIKEVVLCWIADDLPERYALSEATDKMFKAGGVKVRVMENCT